MRNRTQAEEVVSILQSQRETESDSQSFWDARGGPCIIGELAEAWGNTYGGLRAERTQKTDRASLVFASPMWAGAAFMGLARKRVEQTAFLDSCRQPIPAAP